MCLMNDKPHKCNRYTGLLTIIGIESISTDRLLVIQSVVTDLMLVPIVAMNTRQTSIGIDRNTV